MKNTKPIISREADFPNMGITKKQVVICSIIGAIIGILLYYFKIC
jgi:hypothetical protein